MSLYYPSSTCGGSTIPDYACNPCPNYENGRIRSIAFIKNTFTFTDPTSTAEWTTGVNNGDIIIIYETQGSYDGGATSELVGFGDAATVNGNTTHTLTFKDRNYADNCDFYNAIRGSSDYTVAYRTGTLSAGHVHLAGAPVTISPKNPVPDDLNAIVVWEVQLKWANVDSPCPYSTPSGIFDRCFIV